MPARAKGQDTFKVQTPDHLHIILRSGIINLQKSNSMKNFRKLLTSASVTMLFFMPGFVLSQNKTIEGTVYENHTSKTTTLTRDGTIHIYLPDDAAQGDVVNGTVVARPEGKTPAEKRKSLERLMQYALVLPDGSRVSFSQEDPGGPLMGFITGMKIPAVDKMRLEVVSDRNRAVSNPELSVLPAAFHQIPVPEQLSLAKKVLVSNEPMVLLKSSSMDENVAIKLTRFQSVTSPENFKDAINLMPLTSSPRKAVYSFPTGLTGVYNVYVEHPDGDTDRIDLVYIADIQASIGKGNLMRGEVTQLEIEVNGLEECPFRPVRLEIRNHSPSVIQLAEGNYQMIDLEELRAEEGSISSDPNCIVQDVVGEKPGRYLINTVLHAPPAAYENMIEPFVENITSNEEFDRVVEAFQEDISQFSFLVPENKPLNTYLSLISGLTRYSSGYQSLAHAKSALVNLTYPIRNFTGNLAFISRLNHTRKLFSNIAANENVMQYIHPLHQYAGEFHPETLELVVAMDEDQGEKLLAYLGVIRQDNGKYSFLLPDGEQMVQYSDVEVVQIRPDRLRQMANGSGSQLPGSEGRPDARPLKSDSISSAGAEAKGSGSPNQNDKKPGSEGQDVASSLAGKDPGQSQGKSAAESIREGLAKVSSETRATSAGEKAGDSKVKTGSDGAESKENDDKKVIAGKGLYFEDERGRPYFFYKDAECKPLLKGSETGCTEEKDFTEDRNGKPTGRFNKWVWKDSNACFTGSGFCTAMKQIGSIQYIYEDKNCDRLIEIVTFDRFNCPLGK